MTKLQYMPFYVTDFVGDTSHLNAEETGGYLLLLCHLWATGSLPDDDVRLSRITRMSRRAWSKARPMLQAFFYDGWKHKRLEAERAKSREIADTNRTRSANAARVRWNKEKPNDYNETAMLGASSEHAPSNAPSMPGVMLGECHPYQDKEELPFASLTRAISAAPSKARKAAPAKRSKEALDEAFSSFWAAYPRRQGPNPKQPAWKRFETAVRRGADPEAIIASAKAYALDRASEDPKYTAQAMTWLNQERWNDELTAQPAAAPNWDDRLDTLHVTGVWPEGYGPAPGEPGCRVPLDVIEAARRRHEAADADP